MPYTSRKASVLVWTRTSRKTGATSLEIFGSVWLRPRGQALAPTVQIFQEVVVHLLALINCCWILERTQVGFGESCHCGTLQNMEPRKPLVRGVSFEGIPLLEIILDLQESK